MSYVNNLNNAYANAWLAADKAKSKRAAWDEIQEYKEAFDKLADRIARKEIDLDRSQLSKELQDAVLEVEKTFDNVTLSSRTESELMNFSKKDLTNEIVTFGPRMAHDDTVETLYYAQLHAFPPNVQMDENTKSWYVPKKKPKNWIVA